MDLRQVEGDALTPALGDRVGAGTGRSPCGHAEGKRGLCLAVALFGFSLLCALQVYHPAPTKPYRLWIEGGTA